VTSEQNLLVMDTKSFEILSQTDLGMTLYSIAVMPAGDVAYITAIGGLLLVVDVAQGTVSESFDRSDLFEAGFISGIALTPDASLLYVLNNSGYGIAVFDTDTNEFTLRANCTSEANPDLAFSPDGSSLFVSNNRGDVCAFTVPDHEVSFLSGPFWFNVPLDVSPDGSVLYSINKNAYDASQPQACLVESDLASNVGSIVRVPAPLDCRDLGDVAIAQFGRFRSAKK